jgi:hypothetical protein
LLLVSVVTDPTATPAGSLLTFIVPLQLAGAFCRTLHYSHSEYII